MRIRIDHDKCRGDGLCVELCPVQVFAVRVVSTRPKKTRTVVANDEACVLCRICEVNCPNQAIEVLQAML